ncbi:hypothetical protein DAEQUDRAFT_728862 [Daedalea quercina L-15889]|uniref:Uncharacterized protein n=1 Tax=Daedalea quercina L-15889 TaxID=1314783 RepID=A0A165P150_9APHY|nr:hypothetical protein DAEQUDRAFT_728862 [Daedalea quercina L-15889]
MSAPIRMGRMGLASSAFVGYELGTHLLHHGSSKNKTDDEKHRRDLEEVHLWERDVPEDGLWERDISWAMGARAPRGVR